MKEKDYIAIESDILWNNVYNTPENNYKEYRELQLRMCKNISQIDKPVVLCGCTTPKQFEKCYERRYFKDIHYLAVVGSDEVFIKNLTQGRNIKDKDWINSSLNFNRWLKDNADKTNPKIQLLDISDISIENAAVIVDEWICEIVGVESEENK